jgi:hypothetical protein
LPSEYQTNLRDLRRHGVCGKPAAGTDALGAQPWMVALDDCARMARDTSLCVSDGQEDLHDFAKHALGFGLSAKCCFHAVCGAKLNQARSSW